MLSVVLTSLRESKYPSDIKPWCNCTQVKCEM